MNTFDTEALLAEIAEAEREMDEELRGLTDSEKRSLLTGMDDERYERWSEYEQY